MQRGLAEQQFFQEGEVLDVAAAPQHHQAHPAHLLGADVAVGQVHQSVDHPFARFGIEDLRLFQKAQAGAAVFIQLVQLLARVVAEMRDFGEARMRQIIAGQVGVDEYLNRKSGERAIPIIAAILGNKNQYEDVLNLPNRGCIPGLPDWAIVELPGSVSASGIRGQSVPTLPPGVTAMLAQQIAIQDRAVEAALTGDRQAALQALLLDPVVWSYDAAVQILDELLTVHAPYLPQFAPRVPA